VARDGLKLSEVYVGGRGEGWQDDFLRRGVKLLLLAKAPGLLKWLKNRHKILADVYVSPGYNRLPPAPSCAPDTWPHRASPSSSRRSA